MILDLRDPQYWLDPYPRLDAARAEGRTALTHDGEVVLLSADDIDRAHMDPHFAVPGLSNLERLGIFDGPFYEWRSQAMAVMEGADHKRLRGFVGLAFAPSQMDRLRGTDADGVFDLCCRSHVLAQVDLRQNITQTVLDVPERMSSISPA
jgi:cytochrome P450